MFATKHAGSFRKYAYVITVFWTLLVCGSLLWNLYQTRQGTVERARIEARTIFEHNLAYRKWNSLHGGVYAPVTPFNQPNEYLVIPERDIVTSGGIRMTMINPFRMTKQVYSILRDQSPLPTLNRTVSLHPLNTENDPDAWERRSLTAFERGIDEVSEITSIDSEQYLRLLKPYKTVDGCLRCHGFQGYETGDIRGGMSIAVPMAPYYASEKNTFTTVGITHLLLWCIGIFGIVALSRKIDQKQKKILESEWQFRTLSEFAYDWEYWINEKKEIVFMSPSSSRITGYRPDEYVSDPHLLSHIIHPEDRQNYEHHLIDFRSSQHREFEFRILRKDGGVRWISHECGPIIIDGVFMGRRISNRDVTDRKELETQLGQSRKMESMGMLAGGVAHDFNNLLTVIIGYSSMAKDEVGKNPAVAEQYLSYVLQASEKAHDLTSGLLAFSRRQIIRPSVVGLNSIVENMSGLLRRLVPEDIRFTVSLSADEVPVFADPHKMEQVLMNLVTNARDAMPQGGTLSISTERQSLDAREAGRHGAEPGTYMVVTVSDTGKGIGEETLAHIFEPFFTTKEKGEGTGLGLSMIYGIVTQHEGFISVMTETGKGTAFSVYLPASDKELTTGAKHMPPAGTAGSARGNIMVAEDDPHVMTFLKSLLERSGYSVVGVENGLEAVRIFGSRAGEIDLVILDVIMPDLNGREVYERIRALKPDVKVIFMSGYPHDVLSTKGVYEEGLDFMEKPLNRQLLLDKIAMHISGP